MARSTERRTTLANMSTSGSSFTLDDAFTSLPTSLRARLLTRYRDLKSAYINGQYDAAGLRAGRLAEVLLRVLQHELTGKHVPLGSKIENFAEECAKLQRLPKTSGVESLRVIIPRAINFLYTLRNKRGIGHEGGDVEANVIDAATCVRVADWCVAELLRVVHTLSLEEAQALLDAIAEREVPQVWAVAGVKRVLNTGLTYKEQTLLLLYADPDTAVPTEDLLAWTEYARPSLYKRDVLNPLHKARLVEYDRTNEQVRLSPTGASEVDTKILPKIGRRG
jgi:hypothetical protein